MMMLITMIIKSNRVDRALDVRLSIATDSQVTDGQVKSRKVKSSQDKSRLG